MLQWDVVTMLCLLFTATVTPYEIALMELNFDVLFWVNRVVDVCFTLDIGINFMLMYQESSSDGGRMVKNHRRIRNHYMQTWFTIDLLSIIPGYIDCAMVNSSSKDLGAIKTFRATKMARAGRIIRLLRLLKMARILRLNRIAGRWVTVVNFQHSQIALLKNMMTMGLTAHWMACIWVIIPQLEKATVLTWISAWVDANGLVEGCDIEVPYLNGYFLMGAPNNCFHHTDLYAAAIYWAVMTLTSIGYGDITATNKTEYLLCAVVMMIGGCIWAFIIGNICAVVGNVDYTTKHYQETMDQLNYFLRNTNMDFNTCRQLRQYVVFAKDAHRESSRKDLLSKLPPSLGGECAISSSKTLVESNVDWLRKCTGDTILAIVLRMGTHVHAPQETIFAKWTLFVMHKGVCARTGNILTPGTAWGHDFLLHNLHNCDCYPAFTITFVQLSSLTKQAVADVIEVAPALTPIVRQATIKMAIIRGVKRLAREKVEGEGGTIASKSGGMKMLHVRMAEGSRNTVSVRKTMKLSRNLSMFQDHGDNPLAFDPDTDDDEEGGTRRVTKNGRRTVKTDLSRATPKNGGGRGGARATMVSYDAGGGGSAEMSLELEAMEERIQYQIKSALAEQKATMEKQAAKQQAELISTITMLLQQPARPVLNGGAGSTMVSDESTSPVPPTGVDDMIEKFRRESLLEEDLKGFK
jgi:potassium voltage-gated channel Eag-related subfamily H protein 7